MFLFYFARLDQAKAQQLTLVLLVLLIAVPEYLKNEKKPVKVYQETYLIGYINGEKIFAGTQFVTKKKQER